MIGVGVGNEKKFIAQVLFLRSITSNKRYSGSMGGLYGEDRVWTGLWRILHILRATARRRKSD